MQIAFLTHSFPKITETFILNQIAGLLDHNQEVTVIAETESDERATHDFVSEYRMTDKVTYSHDPQSYADGFRVLLSVLPQLVGSQDVSTATFLSELATGKSAPRRLSNVLVTSQEGEFDVYHAHFGSVGNSFLGVTKCRDTPFVVSFYGRDASQLLREDPNRYDDLFQRADAVTALSEDMRSVLVDAGCPRDKTHIRPLSIDTSQFSYRPRTREEGEPIRLLTVARFVEKKGLEYALRAVATLSETHDVEYTIAGDGKRRDRIESLIAELELKGTVNLLGWQSQAEIIDQMADAHLFVLPSVTADNGDKEGTPTVLLEAQAMGLPIVSTYHAGIPEIVSDDDSGLLVPERDSEALAEVLVELADNPERWEAMGRAGRDYVAATHSIEAVSESLVDLYESL